MTLGTALAVSGESYTTKVEALEAADALTELLAELVAWEDANFEALEDAVAAVDPVQPIATGVGAADTGEAMAQLREVVALTVRSLIAASFTLPPERAVVLDRPRGAVELCAELYGELDSFDDFVAQNDFTGDELADEIPRGRRVVYYA